MTPALATSSQCSIAPREPGIAKNESARPGTSTRASSLGSPIPPLRRVPPVSWGAATTSPTSALSTAPAT